MTLDEAKKIVSEGIGFKVGNQLKADKNLIKDTVLEGQAAAAFLKQESTKAARADGEKFLEGNKSKPDVKVTDSGLQYIIHEPGEGSEPEESHKVTVHYEGRLLSGKVFDSSIERGQPAQFGVNRVIPGWIEGLQLMKPGAKFTFFIPQELGYGERGSGRGIPPFSVLIFEVELLSIADEVSISG